MNEELCLQYAAVTTIIINILQLCTRLTSDGTAHSLSYCNFYAASDHKL